MTRPEILDTAKKCVCGDREQDYGTPEQNFSTIAQLWTAYKGLPFTAVDVAVFQALVKIGRVSSGHGKADNWIDLAGYAACGGEIESANPHTPTVTTTTHKPTQAEYEELFAEEKPTVSVLESVEPVKGKYDGFSIDELFEELCVNSCSECPINELHDGGSCTGYARKFPLNFRKIAIAYLKSLDKSQNTCQNCACGRWGYFNPQLFFCGKCGTMNEVEPNGCCEHYQIQIKEK